MGIRWTRDFDKSVNNRGRLIMINRELSSETHCLNLVQTSLDTPYI